jgi:hypothetical protein
MISIRGELEMTECKLPEKPQNTYQKEIARIKADTERIRLLREDFVRRIREIDADIQLAIGEARS